MERREWNAKDTAELRALYPDEPSTDDDALRAARHFGWEVREGIPEGDGFWALEPRCVLRHWARAPGDEKWVCLGCYGTSPFERRILEEFFAALKRDPNGAMKDGQVAHARLSV
jgi:hypothetical protein